MSKGNRLLILGFVGLALLISVYVSTVSTRDLGTSRMVGAEQFYWVEEVANGLSFPSSMAWISDHDMLITERTGGLRVLRSGVLDSKPLRGVPTSAGPDGLKDIVLDPDFSTNRTLYLSIAEGTLERHYAAVYRARYAEKGLENAERIFRSKEERGAYGTVAGRMLFISDGTLLVSVSEDHKERAQQLGSDFGKILRINRDGSIPRDNPFVDTPGALPQIWSFGHRVPLGMYQDVETDTILEVEPGPRGGDELNVLKAGGNFGWAQASWGFRYSNDGSETNMQSGIGIEDPILVWTPSVTPSGITRYRGDVYPFWNGDYFVGHLSGKGLERLRIKDGRVVLQERMLLDLDERIRNVDVGPDNHIYLLTDHQNGRVLRLRPGRPSLRQINRIARKLAQPWIPQNQSEEQGDPVKGQQAFIERCATCHSAGAAILGGTIGPDLTRVYGRPMGREPGFSYSPNMSGSSLQWSSGLLDQFLADPDGIVFGTKMTSPPVTDAEIRQQIIAFLRRRSEEARQ